MDSNNSTLVMESKPSKPITFEERIAYRIADVVVARVIESLTDKFGGMSKLTYHELPGCRLMGLRLSQFERFCEIMREVFILK